jgi:hypothetical protein
VRPRLALLGLALALAGCGSQGAGPREPARAHAGTLESLWRGHGESVGLVGGTSDYSPGLVRVSFLVVRRDGRTVSTPRARLLVARSLASRPFARGVARLEPVGVPGAETDAGDVTHLYVGHVRLRRPGRYWLLAEPLGVRGRPIRGVVTLDVRPRSISPAVGSRAYPSRTPTIVSTHGDFGLLTTRVPPDRGLLRFSIADVLAAHRPFVVVFATPKFCTSRTCGPVVDVVDAARRRFHRSGVRFVHVEIYRRNDPTLGFNRFVRQWHLPTEPWTFLVGPDGRIRAKFEGSVSLGELTQAIRHTLL